MHLLFPKPSHFLGNIVLEVDSKCLILASREEGEYLLSVILEYQVALSKCATEDALDCVNTARVVLNDGDKLLVLSIWDTLPAHALTPCNLSQGRGMNAREIPQLF
jgi:hypothetical protein